MKQVVLGFHFLDKATMDNARKRKVSAMQIREKSPATPENPSTALNMLKKRNRKERANILSTPASNSSVSVTH